MEEQPPTMKPLTNNQLAGLILAWAKDEHPDKYAQTLKVAAIHDTFRRYLLRLIEIRCEADKAWMGTVPVSVLEETKLSLSLRDKQTGAVYEVKGRLAEGERQVSFLELGLSRGDFLWLQQAKENLDLEYVEEAGR
jgi:hypothetical protein